MPTTPATHHQRPEVVLSHLGLALDSTKLTTTQCQRAWSLGFVRTIWPTIDPHTAEQIARWIMHESGESS